MRQQTANMKRLNPNTGKPFKRGDQREDGLYFLGYTSSYTKKDGYFAEQWGTYDKIEHAKAISRQYFKEHDYYRKYQEANAEQERKRGREKYSRTKYTHAARRRMFDRIKRIRLKMGRFPMPPWISQEQLAQMQQVYESANYLEMVTGDFYHVDHIVPLGSSKVCGLHVPWNLQILEKEQNISKGHKVAV